MVNRILALGQWAQRRFIATLGRSTLARYRWVWDRVSIAVLGVAMLFSPDARADYEPSITWLKFSETVHFHADASTVKTLEMLIRIETDSGLVGWGEAFGYSIWPATRQAFEKLVAPSVIGKDESDIAGLSESLQRLLHILGRGGAAMYALSGLDIALWDIAGKIANLPIFRLLGGENKPVFTYATGGYYKEGDKLTACADELAGFVKNGFKAVKLKVGGASMKEEIERVKATRAAISPAWFIPISKTPYRSRAGSRARLSGTPTWLL